MTIHKQAVVILLGMTLLFLAVCFIGYRLHLPEAFTAMAATTFSSFNGALLVALKKDSGETTDVAPQQTEKRWDSK